MQQMTTPQYQQGWRLAPALARLCLLLGLAYLCLLLAQHHCVFNTTNVPAALQAELIQALLWHASELYVKTSVHAQNMQTPS